MDAAPRLSSRASDRFNGVFLGWLLASGTLSILYLFYFNRLFAKFVSILARLYLRWVGDPHYINIQSIQISLLAGRIFFGRVTYHGPNETVTVVSGHVTWRYWYRRVRDVLRDRVEDHEATSVGASPKGSDDSLPCRILVELRGVEWFVYNRSAAFDSILEQATGGPQRDGRLDPSQPSTHIGQEFSDLKRASTPKTGSTTLAPQSTLQRKPASPFVKPFEEVVANSWYLQLLPIRVECNTGAIILGNKNTPATLVARFDKGFATIDARKPRSIDLYKQVFDLEFLHPKIRFEPNEHFEESLLVRGERRNSAASVPAKSTGRASSQRTRRERLYDLLPSFIHSIESFVSQQSDAPVEARLGEDRWRGLDRYLRDNNGGTAHKEITEYAKDTRIAECESATVSYYYDVVGKVPPWSGWDREELDLQQLNGSAHEPPDYRVDVTLNDANIHYGPWADRQRVHLQNMFFPKSYRVPSPMQPLKEGEQRVYMDFRVFVELSGSTTLRVPIREASKDWKYQRRQDDDDARLPGWVEVKVTQESSVSYHANMVPLSSGWVSAVNVDLRNPEVSSSVNNKLLWRADGQTLHCDLSGPLQWNADTKWVFNNESTGMQLFLLREHVTLLTDLVNDWTSGPPSQFATFVPMIYELGLTLHDYQFFFNVNDQNIINNANSVEDNVFLVLKNLNGKDGGLQSSVYMDFREFRAPRSTVEFSVESVSQADRRGAVMLGVSTPVWNTLNSFLHNAGSLGTVEDIKIHGSYDFYSDISPRLVDTLVLNIDGEGVKLTLHGFLIKYFLTVKENYFGDNLHFKTLDEWREIQQAAENGSIEPSHHTKSNDLDVSLGVNAHRLEVLLPKHIYDANQYVRLQSPVLSLDLRFTNYYMDLQVDVAPISASLGDGSKNLIELFLDGLRIFGHRLFGLPPSEPTYVCNWDFDVGMLKGECSLEFVETLSLGVKAFVFSFEDLENTLPFGNPLDIDDVTLLRLQLTGIRLWLRIDDNDVFRLVTDEVNVKLNNLVDEIHSARVQVKVPKVEMTCLDIKQSGPRSTKAHIDTSIELTTFGRCKDATIKRDRQQKHIEISDRRTGRARFMLQDDGLVSREGDPLDAIPPTMSLPSLPPPLNPLRTQLRSKVSLATFSSSEQQTVRSFLHFGSKSSRSAHSWRGESSKEASFHSAFESATDMALNYSSIETPVSTASAKSLGSRSSRLSTAPSYRGMSGQPFEMTPQPLGVSFSSSFSCPSFPLERFPVDLSDLPQLDADSSDWSEYPQKGEDPAAFTDDDTERDSFVVEFSRGIRGYAAPTALKIIAAVVESLQLKSPDDILDAIHIDVISKLEKVIKRKAQHDTVIEACFRVPQFKFNFIDEPSRTYRFANRSEKPKAAAVRVGAQDVFIALRSKDKVTQAEGDQSVTIQKILSMHALSRSLEIMLEDVTRTLRSSPPPAAGLLAEDLLFWASNAEASTTSLQARSFHATGSGKQALFVYDILLRFSRIAKDAVQEFSNLERNEKDRIQHFLSLLSSAGEGVSNEPPALVRPSNVLRSAPAHVRLHDSWKILTRLRHVWQTSPPRTQQEWASKCQSNMRNPIPDMRRSFIAVFQKWRAWEMASLPDSIVVKKIFGKLVVDSHSKQSPNLNARISIGKFELVIDRGPSQHEFVIDQFLGTFMTGSAPSKEQNESEVIPSSAVASTIAQIHTRSIRLSVRWEALEIFEAVLHGLWKRQAPIATSAGPQKVKAGSSSSPSKGIHFVFSTDHGSLTLDTVNLRTMVMAHKVSSSMIVSEKNVGIQQGKPGHIGSVMVRADYVSSELCFSNRVLVKSGIRVPEFYGHLDKHSLAETDFQLWKLSYSCAEFSLDVQEQLLGLMDVAEHVVNDEIAEIHRLIKELEQHCPKRIADDNATTPRVVHMIDGTSSVAEFAISARLLPSFGYIIRGEKVRLSARPNPQDSKEMVIDLEVVNHEHEICSSTISSESRSISLVKLPAVNATLRDKAPDHERLTELAVSIHAITLEASAIQSLLNAVNKPEVSEVIKSAASEFSKTQTRMKEIFQTSRELKRARKPSMPLIYRASVDVDGVTIQTYAPSANLEINLGYIQLRASNRPKADMAILKFPEIRLEFGKITIELKRLVNGGHRELCGYFELHASLVASSRRSDHGTVKTLDIKSHSLKIDLYAETASTVVDVVGHLQDKLHDLDLSREVKYLRKLRQTAPLRVEPDAADGSRQSAFFNTAMSLDMNGIRISWIVRRPGSPVHGMPVHNLVLSFGKIYFETATKKDSNAQLAIEQLLLQMAEENAPGHSSRADNSALLPRIVFNVAYRVTQTERRLAFQAKGEPLDIRLTSSCVIAGNNIENSISTAANKFREASTSWKSTPTEDGAERKKMFGSKRLASILVDADFAGAVVHLSGKSASLSGFSESQQGRYGQFMQSEASATPVLKSPGLAFKVEYLYPPQEDPSLNAEIKVSASDNKLYPTVVPLIRELSESVQQVMKEKPDVRNPIPAERIDKTVQETSTDTDSISSENAAAILGRCRLNIGFRICKQEFTFSCQPIARVAASASFEEIYVTMNTCDVSDGARFYAISAAISNLEVSLQHVYSRESTGNLQVESVVLSLMNSKHVMGSQGLSTILKLSPIRSQLNVKQFQDFLLFREIWVPMGGVENSHQSVSLDDPSIFLVQRYQEVASTKAFPSDATIVIDEVELQLDLGQSLGKSSLQVSNLWMSSRKTSEWEQTMCAGFDSIGVTSTGRLKGSILLKGMKVRTSINWGPESDPKFHTPLIEAAVGFKQLKSTLSFDYQAFFITDIRNFDFLMYNLQTKADGARGGDRLVAVLDGDKIHVFCTTLSAAQGLGMVQALQKLAQEKTTSFETSLKEVERYLSRRSTSPTPTREHTPSISLPKRKPSRPTSLTLHTDVMVNLKEIHVGAFPSSFHDTQIFKLEARDATARFTARMDSEKVHSMLKMTLGHLAVALSPVKPQKRAPGEETPQEVITAATTSKGGIILKVPKVEALMHTWHIPGSTAVEYTFKSSFDGQVDVGWNFSRVSFIKKMWQSHVKAYTERQGKAPAASSITMYTEIPSISPTSSEHSNSMASRGPSESVAGSSKGEGIQEKRAETGKIRAVVNVPQSKYQYTALEEPVIETPQLRDMGEATPPLEWIGLHRDRLPNLTHQIVIVSLLEVAKKVEDSYSRILGST